MLLGTIQAQLRFPKNMAKHLLSRLSILATVLLAFFMAPAWTCNVMAQSTMKLNGGKCPIVDGKPFFAVGVYSAESEDFPMLAEAGFNVVHTYDWDGTANNTSCKAWLDAAGANGLKALVGLYRPKVKAGNFDAQCVQRIEMYHNHPALLAWHTMDEPEWDTKGNMGKDYMPAAKKFIRKHDPHHPVTAVMCHFDDMQRFEGSVDIMQADYYPIPPIPSVNFEGDGFRGIKKYVDLWREVSGGQKPFWFTCQAYDNSLLVLHDKNVPKEWQRFPTRRELQTMTYVAVASGSRGIFYWSLTRLKSEVRSGGTTAQEHWARLKSVTLELKKLMPMLTSDASETIANNNSVVSMVKSDGKYTYVIAANYERKPTETTISIPGVNRAVAKVMFGGGSSTITNGRLPVQLDSIESRVYRIKNKEAAEGALTDAQ